MTVSEIRARALKAAETYQLRHGVKFTSTQRQNWISNFVGGFHEGYQGGREKATQAERGRCAAILALPEAKGRRKTAIHIALETDFSVKQAAALLATAPEGEASAGALPFASHVETGARSSPSAAVDRVMHAAGFRGRD